MELLGALVVLEDCATVGADEVIGTRDDRIEDDINVERRAEGLAHRRERSQLADRASQFASAGFELPEKPHVFDGNDRLVGKGLEQCDFAFVIRLHMSSCDSDRPNHRVLSSHGHNEGALVWGREHESIAIRRKLCIIRDIVTVDYPAFDDAHAYDMVAPRGGGVQSPEDAATFR